MRRFLTRPEPTETDVQASRVSATTHPTPKRLELSRQQPREADVLPSVLKYLALLKRTGRIAWHARMNTGAGRLVDKHGQVCQWTRFGFVGQPDVMGQLPDGRFLALEVKSPTGKLRPDQSRFLDLVAASRGVAGVARRIEDVDAILRGETLR